MKAAGVEKTQRKHLQGWIFLQTFQRAKDTMEQIELGVVCDVGGGGCVICV